MWLESIVSPSFSFVARVQRSLTTGSKASEDDQLMKEVLLGAKDQVDSAEQEVEVELEAEDDYGTGDTYATYKPAKGMLWGEMYASGLSCGGDGVFNRYCVPLCV